MTILSFFARKWIVSAVVAAFIAWSGWLSWKVYSVSTRNLTAYYERKLAQNDLQHQKILLKAQSENEKLLQEIKTRVSLIDTPDDIIAQRVLCKTDPYCKTRSSRSESR